jgi:transcriptional antiterminator NusG
MADAVPPALVPAADGPPPASDPTGEAPGRKVSAAEAPENAAPAGLESVPVPTEPIPSEAKVDPSSVDEGRVESVDDGDEADSDEGKVGSDFSDDIYAAPLEMAGDASEGEGDSQWYILKVQVNREDSIRDALVRRVKLHGMEHFFKEIVVPTEDVAEFTKAGKRRIVKKKIYPGYILVNMIVTEDSWFLVRETGGIGDFTGSAGKPTPMDQRDVDAILRRAKPVDEESSEVKSAIPFKPQDKVRVKEGNFLNFEGDVQSIDQAHGRVRVIITIFGRPTPVDFQHWMLERL